MRLSSNTVFVFEREAHYGLKLRVYADMKESSGGGHGQIYNVVINNNCNWT